MKRAANKVNVIKRAYRESENLDRLENETQILVSFSVRNITEAFR